MIHQLLGLFPNLITVSLLYFCRNLIDQIKTKSRYHQLSLTLYCFRNYQQQLDFLEQDKAIGLLTFQVINSIATIVAQLFRPYQNSRDSKILSILSLYHLVKIRQQSLVDCTSEYCYPSFTTKRYQHLVQGQRTSSHLKLVVVEVSSQDLGLQKLLLTFGPFLIVIGQLSSKFHLRQVYRIH